MRVVNTIDTANALIDKFYEETKEEFGLTKGQINDIVRTPFKLMRTVIEDLENSTPIRIMNIGTFQRSKKRIGYLLKSREEKFNNGKLDEWQTKQWLEQREQLQSLYQTLKVGHSLKRKKDETE